MFKSYWISISFGLAALFLVISFAKLYLAFADASHLLIIHFDPFRGIDFLGDKSDAFGIAWTGVSILLTNLLLAWGFFDRLSILSKFLAVATAALSALILLAVSVIIRIN